MLNRNLRSIEEYKSVLERNPSDNYAHFKLGQVYQETEDYALAIKEFLQARELGLNNARLYLELGRTYREIKEYDLAIEELKKTVDLGLDNDEVHFELGKTYQQKNEYPQAIEEFKIALQRNSSNICNYLELGRTYREIKEYDLAIEELKKTVDLGLDNEGVHRALGFIYKEKGLYELAAKEFKRVLQDSPDSSIHLELGRVYREKKDYDSAMYEIKKAFQLDSDNVEAHVLLATLYREKDEYAFAESELKKALEFSPQNGNLHYELGLIYEINRKYPASIEQMQIALKQGISEEFLPSALARVSRKQRVIEEFEKAINIEPVKNEDSPESLMDIMDPILDYMFQEGYKTFLHKLVELAEANPHNLRVHIELAWIYTWQKQYDLALEELKKIGLMAPQRKIHLELGRVYRCKKEYGLAIKEFEKMIESDSNSALAHIELGLTYAQMGNYSFAIREFYETIKTDPFSREKLKEIHNSIINLKNSPIYERKKVYEEAFFDILKKTDIRQIPNKGFDPDSLGILKNLFPEKIAEIDELIKGLQIDEVYRWRYPVITKADGEIIYLITRLLKPEVIVETGTWMGTSTAYLAKACCDNRRGRVITIDKETDAGYAIPDELLAYIQFHRNKDIIDVLPKICRQESKIDMFFHDSCHAYQHAYWELAEVLPFIRKGGLVVFRDVLNRDIEGRSVVDLFSEIKNNVEAHTFNTKGGLGVIKDIEKLQKIINEFK